MKIFLFTDQNLPKYLSSGWNEELFLQGKVSTLTGRTIEIQNVDEKTTIKELKLLVETKEGIPIERQEIRKGKKILEDNKTLYECWIVDGTKLLLIVEGEVGNYQLKKEEEQPETLSTKLKKREEITKTIVLTPDSEEFKKVRQK